MKPNNTLQILIRRGGLIFAFCYLLFVGSCCNHVLPPPLPTNCEYPAGNRNFTWRFDTVAWWPSTLGGVWVFSDSDAYVMGYVVTKDSPATVILGRHWNGINWETNINGTVDEIKHVANDVTGDGHYMVSVGNWSINPPKPALGEFDNRTKRWRGYQFQTQGELRSVWTDGSGYFIAVGDNGMVYIKNGYAATWVYSQAPTNFSFYRVTGVSKTEMYLLGYKSVSGTTYPQFWKYDGSQWLRLRDDLDTTGTVLKFPEADNSMGDMAVVRCSYTDSVKLYIIGWESYLVESKGNQLNFKITNLSELGLPLRSIGRTGLDISLYSPNDYWVFGTRYNFYHWNGNNFQHMIIPGLPNDDIQFGDQRKMVKTKSGKVFLPTEVNSQVYVVVQGTP